MAASLSEWKVTQKIMNLPIAQIAKQTNFEQRAARKITGQNFVVAFFDQFNSKSFSLEQWAAQIADYLSADETVSKQALAKRLQLGRQAFGKQLLCRSIEQAVQEQPHPIQSPLLKSFKKAFVEDSMCVSLPDNVASVIPGPHSKNGVDKSTARIQLTMDLITGCPHQIALNSYRDNDQSYAYESITNGLQGGDLLIRDLGYYALGAFEQMNEDGIFFLSRHKPNVHIRLCEHDSDPLDLLSYLKQSSKGKIDTDVFVGNQKVPCRLVAIKLPLKVAQRKRKKAAKDRGSKTNHSEEYYELLGWNLYITNVGREVWTANQVQKAYALRWRIEIIFRCWKSRLNIEKYFNKKQSQNPGGVLMILYLALTWITLYFNNAYCYFFTAVLQTKQVYISIEKFADYAKSRLNEIIYGQHRHKYITKVAYYCKYDKRTRNHFFDELYYENLS